MVSGGVSNRVQRQRDPQPVQGTCPHTTQQFISMQLCSLPYTIRQRIQIDGVGHIEFTCIPFRGESRPPKSENVE